MKNVIKTENSKFLYYLIDNIIKYYIPILYLLISVMFYLRTYDSCQIKITLTQIGGSVLILLWLLKFLENPKETIKFYLANWQIIVPFVLFLLSGLQSHIFMSPLKKASGMELYRRVIYMLTAIVVIREVNSIEKFNRFLRWLFMALFISTFYGIIQYIDGKFFLPNPEPGIDPFIWRQAFGKRIFSTFGNPNFYGDFLVGMSPIVLAMFVYKKNPFYLLLWLMTAFNTIFTYSKGAWIGFVAGFVYFCFLYLIFFSHTKVQNIKKYVFVGILGVILITAIGIYKQWTINTDSAKFRIYTWLSCWEMINTSPLLGTGIGTFYVTYPAWRRPQIFYIEGKHNTESDHPENEYLEVWYDEGVIGFGIFLWLIITLIITAIKTLEVFSKPTIITDKKGRQKQISEDIRAYYMLGLLSGWMGSLTHNWVCVSMRFVSSGTVVWLLAGLVSALVINHPLPVKSKERNVVSTFTAMFLISIFWVINFLWWKMTENISFTVAIILFIIGLLMESGNVQIDHQEEKEIKFNFNILFQNPIKRFVQLVLIIVVFYLANVFRGYFVGDIHHNIAIFYSKQANWQEALTNYNIVAKNNPGFIMCHYFMGNVFNDRWLMQREFHPEYGDSERNQPWTEIDIGKIGRIDPERAIAKYQDVWDLAPNYVQSHHQAGVVYLKLADYFKSLNNEQKAVFYYNKSLEYFWKYHKIDPIFPVNYQRMAYVYSRLGNLDMAERMYKGHLFTQWLCQSVEDVINLKKLKTEQEKQEYEEIRKQFEEEKSWYCCDYHKREHYLLSTEDWAKRRAQEYSDSYLQLAIIELYSKNNHLEAEKFALRAIKRYKQNFNAWKFLAKFYQDTRQKEKFNNLLNYYKIQFPEDTQFNNLTK